MDTLISCCLCVQSLTTYLTGYIILLLIILLSYSLLWNFISQKLIKLHIKGCNKSLLWYFVQSVQLQMSLFLLQTSLFLLQTSLFFYQTCFFHSCLKRVKKTRLKLDSPFNADSSLKRLYSSFKRPYSSFKRATKARFKLEWKRTFEARMGKKHVW